MHMSRFSATRPAGMGGRARCEPQHRPLRRRYVSPGRFSARFRGNSVSLGPAQQNTNSN